MIYTGLERYTDEELSRVAHGGSDRVPIELARRLDAKNAAILALSKEAAGAVALAGVNPIPMNTGEEE